MLQYEVEEYDTNILADAVNLDLAEKFDYLGS
jgi:hypothetical protein